VITKYVLFPIALVGAVFAQSETSLDGVVDFHCHSAPDAVPRSIGDFDLAVAAQQAGLRGIVLKNHFVPTADRAQIVMQRLRERKDSASLEVYGGIVLNRSVGGLNAEAVRRLVAMEGNRGKVVWLPTIDAECQVKFSKETRPFVSVVRDGRPVPQLGEIFSLIAQHDLVFATGHSSADESVILVTAAKKAGVKQVLITHVLAEAQRATPDHVRQFAKLGAVMEITWSGLLPPGGAVNVGRALSLDECVRAIKSVGAEHFLISSDLGQVGNPPHMAGLREATRTLRQHGLTDGEIKLLMRRNPAKLVGLPVAD
jgi:hypothetical protein